ncbi:MAG: hypothetical protein IT165_11225 [Bryobacterales bacterium]|nr:hypothetical protein [Bryobacterales bacterium]
MKLSTLTKTALLAALTLLPAATLSAHDGRHYRKHYKHAKRYSRHAFVARYGPAYYGPAYYYPVPVYRPRVVVVEPAPVYPVYVPPPPVYVASPPGISIGVYIGR